MHRRLARPEILGTMAFSIRCSCGRETPFRAAEAGTEVHCQCGLTLPLPSLGDLRKSEVGQPIVSQPSTPPENAPSDSPEKKPGPQVHLLAPAAHLERVVRPQSLEHYVHAVMRTIEESLGQLPETPGMDFRAAVAILPDGPPLVEVEFRPALLHPPAVEVIRQQLQSLARPPVRIGPVAFLAFWLVRGGSSDLRNSFRHLYGPYFRVECPSSLATVLAQAQASVQRSTPRQARPEPDRITEKIRVAMQKAWSALFPKAAVTRPAEEDQPPYSLDSINAQIARRPRDGKLFGRRGDFYRGIEKFDLAIADYSRQIELTAEPAQAYFDRGICCRLTGNEAKALEDFHEAIWRKPQWADALAARAWSWFALGKADRAMEDISRAIELEPEELNWRIARARLLAATARFDEAMADLDHVLALDPHHSEGLFLRGSIYRDRPCPAEQAKADFQAAMADFSAVVRLNPNRAEAYALRASICLRLEDLDAAGADCQRAIELDAKCMLAYRVRGKLRQQQGKLEQALEDFSAAIELVPNEAIGYVCRAEAYAVDSQLEKEVADCDRAIEIDGQCAPAYALRGLGRFQLGQHDLALADCSEALRLGLGLPNVYLCRANIYFLKDRLPEAMADCNQALQVMPGFVDALSARGMVRTRLGLFREALSDFNQAVRRAPESPVLYLHRGNAYGTLEDHEAALDDFSEAIRLDPDFAVAYYSRAVAWLHKGDTAQASDDCDAAIHRDPNLAAAHFLRGRLLDQLGVPGEAIVSYNDAIRLAPDFAAAYAGRANAFVNAGDYDQAIADYHKAIDREPAAGQMLGQLDEEYAVEAIVRGLAEAEPGRGNLFLAGFLAHSHSLDEALDHCQAAMDHLPADEVLGAALQMLQQRIDEAGPGQFRRIEAWFQEAAGPEGRSVQLDLLLAHFRDIQGRYPERCEIYRQLVERSDVTDPQRALACNNLAYFLAIREEDVTSALELANQAVELTGPFPEFLDTRGVALLAAGRYDDAVAELRRVVGNKPTGLRLYHLARACHAAGDMESALEAWDEAHHVQELTLQQVPFYEQHQYRATAKLLDKDEET
jgi:tetratricopeptide (TPR) repeat protein